MSLLRKLADYLDPPLEVKPGLNVFSGKTMVLKVRVWREKDQRWYDLPDQVTDLDGAPR